MIYRGYYTLARLYEVYHLVEKSFFHKKINFICSNQRVIFFLLHRYECFENKKKLDKKQRKNKGMTSAISSLVRIWKISHSYPGCSFVWKIRVVYFSVKYSYLCNKNRYKKKGRDIKWRHTIGYDIMIKCDIIFIFLRFFWPKRISSSWVSEGTCWRRPAGEELHHLCTNRKWQNYCCIVRCLDAFGTDGRSTRLVVHLFNFKIYVTLF